MKRHTASRAKSNGNVRIISGRFRGRKLPILDVLGLRPTTDKNKEMLFSWLMPYVRDTICLDAFAGSGGLGFEALSRYAASCTFIELDNMAAKKLAENIHLLGLSSQEAKVVRGNTLDELKGLDRKHDLIFLDPPFNQSLLPSSIERIVENSLLAVDGVIYIECEGQGLPYTAPKSWQLIKEKRSAQVLARLYQRTE